jgi:hypothetical protein
MNFNVKNKLQIKSCSFLPIKGVEERREKIEDKSAGFCFLNTYTVFLKTKPHETIFSTFPNVGPHFKVKLYF